MIDDPAVVSAPPATDPAELTGLVTERLEAEICTLAGHLAAATCRWLELLAEYDARGAWRAWEQQSCAGWLSWKCGLSLTTAHEHVRVARSLVRLPHTRAEFGAGRLSYAKARAITRVATPDDEDGWVACALGCTAAQLDRLAAACRKVTRRQSETRAEREKLSWRWDDDGMLVVTARLAPEHGAALVAAVEATQHAASDTEDAPPQSSAEDSGPARDETPARPGCGRVEALAVIADRVLADGPPVDPAASGGSVAGSPQVVIHVDHPALSGNEGRCHLDNGPSIHPATLRRMTCVGGTAFTVHHDRDGTPLDVGRTTRTTPTRLRRAVLDRAGGRCQYPGCEHRAWLQLHHVIHWIDGGPTAYRNLAVLCGRHHRTHHAGRYTITYDPHEPGDFRFQLADGELAEYVPQLPPLVGSLADHHPATITADTIQPAWAGDPLHLDYAVEVMTQTHNAA